MSRANFYEGAAISIQIGWHILFSLKMCLQRRWREFFSLPYSRNATQSRLIDYNRGCRKFLLNSQCDLAKQYFSFTLPYSGSAVHCAGVKRTFGFSTRCRAERIFCQLWTHCHSNYCWIESQLCRPRVGVHSQDFL